MMYLHFICHLASGCCIAHGSSSSLPPCVALSLLSPVNSSTLNELGAGERRQVERQKEGRRGEIGGRA